MFKHKIKIDKNLYTRLAAAASKQGYSSTEEFIDHVLEQAAGSADNEESEQAVRNRLKGLGYIE